MRATDNGGRSAEGLVTVTVNRNLNAPRFENAEYTSTIQDNEPLSSSFLRVTAEDADVQVRETPARCRTTSWNQRSPCDLSSFEY